MNPFLRREHKGVEYTPGPEENPREVARNILEEIYRLCPVFEKGLPQIDGKEIPLAAYLGLPRDSFLYHKRTWRKALRGLLKAGEIDNSLHSRMCAEVASEQVV